MSTTPNTSDFGKPRKRGRLKTDFVENIEVLKDCVCFRPVGTISTPELRQFVTRAIEFTLKKHVPKLLFNGLGLTDYARPTLADRYFAGREWAAAARGAVCGAFVIPLEMIDPEKFGVTVARNAGMHCDVFTIEAEASKWLATQPV